ADAICAEGLEEGQLRLHRDDVRRHGVDESPAETRACLRDVLAAEVGVAAQLDGQQVGLRVEPDDELAALALDGLGEPVTEARGRDGLLGSEVFRHRPRTLAPRADTGPGPRRGPP